MIPRHEILLDFSRSGVREITVVACWFSEVLLNSLDRAFQEAVWCDLLDNESLAYTYKCKMHTVVEIGLSWCDINVWSDSKLSDLCYWLYPTEWRETLVNCKFFLDLPYDIVDMFKMPFRNAKCRCIYFTSVWKVAWFQSKEHFNKGLQKPSPLGVETIKTMGKKLFSVFSIHYSFCTLSCCLLRSVDSPHSSFSPVTSILS